MRHAAHREIDPGVAGVIAAIDDPNPVIFMEHKQLYRSIKGEVTDDWFRGELGKAAVVRSGAKATIVTYGACVHWALEMVDSTGADVEVIDLRTLVPLDEETILASIKKTGRALVLHEATLTGGFGAEIAARIGEAAFEYLDAPVTRLAARDTPVPFSKVLEAGFLPKARLASSLEALLAY